MTRPATRCTAQIDGPKIDASGNVAWRRQCKLMTTHSSGRCRFHPTRYDDRLPEYPGMRSGEIARRRQRATPSTRADDLP